MLSRIGMLSGEFLHTKTGRRNHADNRVPRRKTMPYENSGFPEEQYYEDEKGVSNNPEIIENIVDDDKNYPLMVVQSQVNSLFKDDKKFYHTSVSSSHFRIKASNTDVIYLRLTDLERFLQLCDEYAGVKNPTLDLQKRMENANVTKDLRYQQLVNINEFLFGHNNESGEIKIKQDTYLLYNIWRVVASCEELLYSKIGQGKRNNYLTLYGEIARAAYHQNPEISISQLLGRYENALEGMYQSQPELFPKRAQNKTGASKQKRTYMTMFGYHSGMDTRVLNAEQDSKEQSVEEKSGYIWSRTEVYKIIQKTRYYSTYNEDVFSAINHILTMNSQAFAEDKAVIAYKEMMSKILSSEDRIKLVDEVRLIESPYRVLLDVHTAIKGKGYGLDDSNELFFTILSSHQAILGDVKVDVTAENGVMEVFERKVYSDLVREPGYHGNFCRCN